MKAFIVTSLLAFFGGCNSTPLPEYNYRGAVPGSTAVDLAMVTNFSATLAHESGLRIVDQTKPTGNVEIDATVSVHLRPKSDERIYVTVMGHRPTRTLFVRVAGNIESPKAKDIARNAEAIYEREYPGSKLTAFIRYEGLLGP